MSIDFLLLNTNFRKKLDDAIVEEDMKNQIEVILHAAVDGVVGHQISNKVFVIRTEESPISQFTILSY